MSSEVLEYIWSTESLSEILEISAFANSIEEARHKIFQVLDKIDAQTISHTDLSIKLSVRREILCESIDDHGFGLQLSATKTNQEVMRELEEEISSIKAEIYQLEKNIEESTTLFVGSHYSKFSAKNSVKCHKNDLDNVWNYNLLSLREFVAQTEPKKKPLGVSIRSRGKVY